jgi:hypothetical protein
MTRATRRRRTEPERSGTEGAGRELVVLVDGPWARRCYWRDDLDAMQRASRSMGYLDGHPAAVLRGYRPTDEQQPHPDDAERTVRVFRFTPPDADTTADTSPQNGPVAAFANATEPAVAGSGGGRVLVTGSRTWTDRAAIRDGLAAVWGAGDRVLVTGACPTGADALAEACWRAWGGQVEPHPADWDTHGRAAGPRRNTEMVAAGAQVCVAFIRDNSRGASHLAGLSEAAGIPVHRHEHDPAAATSDGERAHQAVVVPAPRRPLDDEIAQREQLHRIHHDHQQQHEQTAQDGHEREGALW